MDSCGQVSLDKAWLICLLSTAKADAASMQRSKLSPGPWPLACIVSPTKNVWAKMRGLQTGFCRCSRCGSSQLLHVWLFTILSMSTYVHMYIYICIYMQREGEGERERGSKTSDARTPPNPVPHSPELAAFGHAVSNFNRSLLAWLPGMTNPDFDSCFFLLEGQHPTLSLDFELVAAVC